jgi:hypothetical protein
MPSLALEKQVNKEIIGAGLAGCVSIEALQKLAELVEQHGRLELVGDVLREVQRGGPLNQQQQLASSWFEQLFYAGRAAPLSERTNADAITLADIEAAVTQLRGGGPSRDDVAVISAFDIPKISYDPVSSKMYADKAPRTLFPGARVCIQLTQAACQSSGSFHPTCPCKPLLPRLSSLTTLQAKHSLYLDRLQLIQQRMNRNMRFQQRTQLLARPGDNNVAQVGTSHVALGCDQCGQAQGAARATFGKPSGGAAPHA